MALSQNTYVHMEAVEETENEGKESDKDESTEGFGMAGGKQPSRIMVRNAYSCHEHGNVKRKTDKQWF